MPKYKNITKHTLTVLNVGTVKAGEIIESDEELLSANLEKVNEGSQPTSQPKPNVDNDTKVKEDNK